MKELPSSNQSFVHVSGRSDLRVDKAATTTLPGHWSNDPLRQVTSMALCHDCSMGETTLDPGNLLNMRDLVERIPKQGIPNANKPEARRNVV